MQLRVQKGRPEAGSQAPTPQPAAAGAVRMSAKMHFYAVRQAGDQLRWDETYRTFRRPDRMEGR
jgi:hypothetical protein